MKKTLLLLTSLLIATSASALTVSKPIIKFDGDNLSEVDYNSFDKLDRYEVFVFKKGVEEESLVSGTGFYDKNSQLVSLLHNKDYSVYSFTSFVTRKNKDNSIFVGNKVSYKEKATTKTNKDGSTSTSESMGFLNDGFTVHVKPDDKNANISIKQEDIVSIKPFVLSDGAEIELPELNVWKANLDFLPENKVARFDSPVYSKDGKQYKNIYLIEKR